MDRSELLRMIAQRGYDAGYSAKLHFSTHDIVDKLPGWIGLITSVIGVYALAVDQLDSKFISASLVAIGIAGLYLNVYSEKRQDYFEVGRKLTDIFNKLKKLHLKVKSASADDLAVAELDFDELSAEINNICLSRQVFLASWLAHAKFFWAHQIDWIAEDRPFKFLRDKIPLSFYLFLVLGIVGLLTYKYVHAGCVL